MPDAIAYPAIGLLAAGLIALALVWPQGQGAPSPAPFGRPLAPINQPVAAPVAATPSAKPSAAQPAAGPDVADANGFAP
jgi:hypothetical protein